MMTLNDMKLYVINGMVCYQFSDIDLILKIILLIIMVIQLTNGFICEK